MPTGAAAFRSGRDKSGGPLVTVIVLRLSLTARDVNEARRWKFIYLPDVLNVRKRYRPVW